MEEENVPEILIDNQIELIKVNNDRLGLAFRIDRFNDDREYVSFVKTCVRQIRSSPEYSNFISYLRSTMELNTCAVLNKLSTENVKIELHHHCFTLFEIVECIVGFLLAKKMPFNTFLVSYLVMQEHYANNIGLIPLSSSVHELVHAGGLFIHKDLVVGNHQQFYEDYKPYMPKEVKEKYKSWITDSTNNPNERVGIPIFSDGSKRFTFLEQVSTINVATLQNKIGSPADYKRLKEEKDDE